VPGTVAANPDWTSHAVHVVPSDAAKVRSAMVALASTNRARREPGWGSAGEPPRYWDCSGDEERRRGTNGNTGDASSHHRQSSASLARVHPGGRASKRRRSSPLVNSSHPFASSGRGSNRVRRSVSCSWIARTSHTRFSSSWNVRTRRSLAGSPRALRGRPRSGLMDSGCKHHAPTVTDITATSRPRVLRPCGCQSAHGSRAE
jgi:hypothetical protein